MLMDREQHAQRKTGQFIGFLKSVAKKKKNG
jgi:hypothetical protein